MHAVRIEHEREIDPIRDQETRSHALCRLAKAPALFELSPRRKLGITHQNRKLWPAAPYPGEQFILTEDGALRNLKHPKRKHHGGKASSSEARLASRVPG